jgi:hypothetical protein
MQVHLKSPGSASDELSKEARSQIDALYRSIAGNFECYVVHLLKIITSATPSKNNNANFFSIENEIQVLGLWEEKRSKYPNLFNLELARHREILLQHISSILLILLKMFKRNSKYPFKF